MLAQHEGNVVVNEMLAKVTPFSPVKEKDLIVHQHT